MSVSVVVPRSPGSCEYRDAVWTWLRARWAGLHPTWELVEGIAPADPWSKGAAVADAAERATGDVVVVADADLFVDPSMLERAVAMATDGWIVPFTAIRRLDRSTTRQVLATDPTVHPELPRGRRGLDRIPYSGRAGGGLLVATRADLDIAGWFDPYFTGWGGEDVSIGWALDTLTTRHRRLKGNLWHLWHPPHPDRRPGGKAPERNDQLAKRYRDAEGRPDRMRAVITERTRS